MGNLVATTATNIQGLGNSSQGPRAVVVKKKPMSAEQKLKCKRKRTEAAQYASMGMKPSCGG